MKLKWLRKCATSSETPNNNYRNTEIKKRRMRFEYTFLVIFIAWPLAAAAQHSAIMPPQHKEIVTRYCFDCHDSGTTKGQVDLEDLSFDLGIGCASRGALARGAGAP